LELLIRRGRVVDPVGGIGGVMDVLISNGRVLAIGNDLRVGEDAQVIDAKGFVVSAGLIDMHVHLREPGQEHKETIETGCLAAARGGVTTMACMPNTRPAVDTADRVEWVLGKAHDACGVHVLPIGAVTVGEEGEQLTDFASLKKAGAIALSDDGMPIQNANIMRDALIMAHRQGMTIFSHCEDANMVGNYAVNEGPVSRRLKIPGRPAIAEELMIARDAMLAEETGAAVHICHVSTARSVEIIRRSKERGIAITCETCPQYFTLTEEEVLRQGSMARVNPPLRTQLDVDGIIEGLKDGTIDVIATDHAPHSDEEKSRDLVDAPSGMVGLETSLALTLTALYHTGRMSLSDILRKMTINPARILGTNSGHLAVGMDADLVIFDPDEYWVIDPKNFASKSHNTPFGGCKVRGKVKYTIASGKVIYQEG